MNCHNLCIVPIEQEVARVSDLWVQAKVVLQRYQERKLHEVRGALMNLLIL